MPTGQPKLDNSLRLPSHMALHCIMLTVKSNHHSDKVLKRRVCATLPANTAG